MAATAPEEGTSGAQGPKKIGGSADASPQSEWTASDRRGPLSAADDDSTGHDAPSESDVQEASEQARHPDEPAAITSPVATLSDPDRAEAGPASDVPPDAAPPVAERPVSEPPVAGLAGSRRGSALPLVSALVLGAIIGAGSAAIVYALASGGHRGANEEAAQVASLASRVDAMEKRPDLQGAVQDLQREVAGLRRNISANDAKGSAPDAAALNQKLAALQSQMNALNKAPRPDPGAAAEQTKAVEGLQGSVTAAQHQAAATQSQVADLRTEQKALADKFASLQSAVGSARTDAASTRTELGAVQSQQKALEGRVNAPALAVVADSLVEQVDAGKPYARQVDALSQLGADPAKMAVLKQEAQSGVPSAQALLASFEPLENGIIATGSKQPTDAGFVQRLRSGLTGLVSVRREGATGGKDLASRVALIEADLTHGDVLGAYNVWDALPPPAKQVSQSWGARAKTSVEAISAARDLRGDAINALGGKRS